MRKWLLMGIITLGFLLRVVDLPNHPTGFTPDEASFGYDAYSLLKTGKDQWGNAFPISFKSFGDYKLPVYTYLALPSVKAFGLNEFAVRLPNVIIGTLAVITTYFLALKLFANWRAGLMSALLLAISPWHIMLSRGAFEANLTTFFLTSGILFFLTGLKNHKFLVLSAIFFGLNMFTYHTARLLTPLIVFFLIFQNLKTLKRLNPAILFSAIIFLVFFSWALLNYFSGGGARLTSSSIFSQSENILITRFDLLKIGEPHLLAKIFNNKFTYLSGTFVTNYLSYFSPQFLFTNGAGETTYGMLPGVGVTYLFEASFLFVFLFAVLTKKFSNPAFQFLLFWILISPIPASLSVGPGYAANRAAFIMPALQIASALGGLFLYDILQNRINKKVLVATFSVVSFVSFISFSQAYWFGQPKDGAKSMIYGTSQIMNFITNHPNDYQKIIISKNISEPQIYVAFYTKMNPEVYQKETNNWNFQNQGLSWVDQLGDYQLGKFEFKNLNINLDFKQPDTLLIGQPSEFPENTKPIYVVNYLNQSPAYYLVNTTTK